MKLIKPYYKIVTPINGDEILKNIEFAARSCYNSEDKIGTFIKCKSCTFDSFEKCDREYKRFCCKSELVPYGGLSSHIELICNKLMPKKHEAMFEFGGHITVQFICDRGVSHEFVRHRMASFAQESTRYCNYGKDEHIQFIIPCWLDIEEGICKTTITVPSDDAKMIWLRSMHRAELDYNKLIKIGWSPQQARAILPHSLKTKINVSANIREWRTIFKQRTPKDAHPQMRELMCPLLDEFKTKIPILFDDINY